MRNVSPQKVFCSEKEFGREVKGVSVCVRVCVCVCVRACTRACPFLLSSVLVRWAEYRRERRGGLGLWNLKCLFKPWMIPSLWCV